MLEARSDVVGSLLRPPMFADFWDPERSRGAHTSVERSGSLELLRCVPEGTIAVSGLVTTKSGRRETVEELAVRIRAAGAFCPLDRLALSSQWGFTTSVLGNALTVEDERAKLRTIGETAAAVWG